MADTIRKRLELANGSHQHFVNRTQQELDRAERYCLFLSLLTLDITDFIRATANRAGSGRINHETVYVQLEIGLRNSLRSSDVVSTFERNRLGILLMETSRSGLEAVRNRIEMFVKDFLKGELSLPFEPTVELRGASFPEDADRFSNLTAYLTSGV